MKCLLTGANGNLGQELQKVANKSGIEYFPINGRKECDITNENSIQEYFLKNENILSKIDKIVHCAAYTNVSGAEINKKQAVELNIIGTRNISKFCELFGVILVYVSTDYVYFGDSGNYSETDITRPVNFYALTKLAGESYVRSNGLIIRTSFKPSKWKYSCAFSDLYTSADYIDVIAEKINFLIANNAQGIFNVGTERKSIFELAQRRNKHVIPVSKRSISDLNLPGDVSLNIEKYKLFCNNIVGGKNGRE